jgi:hypothetical protein
MLSEAKNDVVVRFQKLFPKHDMPFLYLPVISQSKPFQVFLYITYRPQVSVQNKRQELPIFLQPLVVCRENL